MRNPSDSPCAREKAGMSATSGCSTVWRPWRTSPRTPCSGRLWTPCGNWWTWTACPTSAALTGVRCAFHRSAWGTVPSGCSAATGKPGRERAMPPYLSRSATTTICLPTPPTGKTAYGPCWGTTAPSSSTRPTSSRRRPGRCTGKTLPKGRSWTCVKPWGERGSSPPPNGCGRKFPHCGTPSSAVKMTRTPRGWPFA